MYVVILEITKKHYYDKMEYKEVFIREHLREFEDLEKARDWLKNYLLDRNSNSTIKLEKIETKDGYFEIVMEYMISNV